MQSLPIKTTSDDCSKCFHYILYLEVQEWGDIESLCSISRCVIDMVKTNISQRCRVLNIKPFEGELKLLLSCLASPWNETYWFLHATVAWCSRWPHLSSCLMTCWFLGIRLVQLQCLMTCLLLSICCLFVFLLNWPALLAAVYIWCSYCTFLVLWIVYFLVWFSWLLLFF